MSYKNTNQTLNDKVSDKIEIWASYQGCAYPAGFVQLLIDEFNGEQQCLEVKEQLGELLRDMYTYAYVPESFVDFVIMFLGLSNNPRKKSLWQRILTRLNLG